MMVFSSETPSGIWLFIPPLHEIVISLICLIIIALVVAKKAVPAFYKILDSRTAGIESKLTEATQKLDEAKQLEQKNVAQIAELQQKASKIQQDAVDQAKSIVKKAEDDAQKRFDSTVANAQKKIEQNKQQAVKDVEAEVKKVAVVLAQKIVEKALSQDDLNAKLLDKMTSGDNSTTSK
jgi:F-type H+-transporting ATPase subunit b